MAAYSHMARQHVSFPSSEARLRHKIDVRPSAEFLNQEVRGSNHNPCDEGERAGKHDEIDEELGHGTLPIHRPPLAPRAKATPVIWRKGDRGLPK